MSYCHWWCPKCKEEVAPSNVTYQECHETCGCSVEWIDVQTTQELIPKLERDNKVLADTVRRFIAECRDTSKRLPWAESQARDDLSYAADMGEKALSDTANGGAHRQGQTR